MIDYSKFQKALRHLELQFHNYQTLDPALSSLMHEAVAESVIQRFETCYDCMWKVLKRYLIDDLGIPEVPNSPKPILRMAFENDILQSAIKSWLSYADARTSTSHDYSGEKASAALLLMNDYIKDAIELYQTMTNKNWE